MDGQNVFAQPGRSDLIRYDNIQKITTDQGDDYITGYLLDYNYCKKYKMIAIDLSKQQALDADPEAIQPISFYGNQENNAVIFFIIEEVKEAALDFSR